MNEVNAKLFDDFKQYLILEDYEVDLIGEESIRGIKGTVKFHFFFDYKYYEYCMYISDNNYKKWATIFLENNDGTFKLNHKGDNRNFNQLEDVIKFTVENAFNEDLL